MGRSQKNARRGQPSAIPSEGGAANRMPADVTQKDGSQNIAGNVTRQSSDVLYQQENVEESD